MNSVRTLFKKIVADLKGNEEDLIFECFRFSSHRSEWFEEPPKKGNNYNQRGKYFYLTDDFIDNMPSDLLENDLIQLIADCFRQR